MVSPRTIPQAPRLLDRMETAYVVRESEVRLRDVRSHERARAAVPGDLEPLIVAARESLREEDRPDPFSGDVRGFKRWVRGRVPRARVVESFVSEVAERVHARGKKLGGYLFSTCLAPLVGQDYAALARHLELFSPMLYRNARERNGIAPVNTEIHTVAS